MRIEDEVGARIRAFRQARGLSQTQLGQLTEQAWPRQVVSAMENGDRAFAVAELAALARALGVSITDLVGETVPAAADLLRPTALRLQVIEQQVRDLRTELEALSGGSQ